MSRRRRFRPEGLLRVRVLQGARGFIQKFLEHELWYGGAEEQGFADGSTVWQVYFWTRLEAADVQERIWAQNGGGWCEVVEVDPETGRPEERSGG